MVSIDRHLHAVRDGKKTAVVGRLNVVPDNGFEDRVTDLVLDGLGIRHRR